MNEIKDLIVEKIIFSIVDDIGFVRKGCQFSTRPLFNTEINAFINQFDIYPFCKSLIE